MQYSNEIVEVLTQREGDFTFLVPCLDLTLYWSGSPFDRAEGIVAFYDRSLSLIGPGLRFYRTETMRRDRAIGKDTLGLVPFWFGGTATRRDIYHMLLETAPRPNETSDQAFTLEANPSAGFVRLALPLSYAAESGQSFLNLCLDLGRTLRFDFGIGGISVNWRPTGDYDMQAVRAIHTIARRYRGIELPEPGATKYISAQGLKCVNWLTLLSQALSDRLGDGEALRRALGEGLTVHSLGDHGILIQAGDEPGIGDVNRRETLPAYHQVGRALAAIRTPDHPPIFGPSGRPDRDVTNEWLARFDS